MTRNKNGFYKIVKKNIASETNHTSTMIDVESLKEKFANTRKSLASGSNCSNLGVMIIPKSVDKTFFLYPTDANKFCWLMKNCKTTNSSALDGLSNNL